MTYSFRRVLLLLCFGARRGRLSIAVPTDVAIADISPSHLETKGLC